MKRVLILLLALLFALSGCGGGSSPAGGAPDYEPVPASAPDEGARASSGESLDRQIARNAYVTLRIENLNEAAASIRLLAAELKGRVSREELYDSSGSGATSTITIMVPSNQLDTALDRLASFGTVEHRMVNSVDVTEEVIDIDSRVKTMPEGHRRHRG
jgi:hypothetical protein